MSRRYARILFASCTAVLAAILGVTAALAATTWTITPGGATQAASAHVTFRDTKTRSTIDCYSVTASGTLKSGSGLPGADAGSIAALGDRTCNNSLGPTFVLHPRDLPWQLNFTSYNATKGVVTGNLSHIRIKVDGPSCATVIAGTSATASDGVVKFRYTDGTGQLTTLTSGGNLHFYNVKGCAGLFINGDPVTLSATFTVSPQQAITSP